MILGFRKSADPLTRVRITRASSVMLPFYGIFDAWLGFTYLLTPTDHLVRSTAVFQTANEIFPMKLWGCLFLLISALQWFALWRKKRDPFIVSLALMTGIMLVWLVVFSVAVFKAGASPAAPAWPALGMVAAFASLRTLEHGEARQ